MTEEQLNKAAEDYAEWKTDYRDALEWRVAKEAYIQGYKDKEAEGQYEGYEDWEDERDCLKSEIQGWKTVVKDLKDAMEQLAPRDAEAGLREAFIGGRRLISYGDDERDFSKWLEISNGERFPFPTEQGTQLEGEEQKPVDLGSSKPTLDNIIWAHKQMIEDLGRRLQFVEGALMGIKEYIKSREVDNE